MIRPTCIALALLVTACDSAKNSAPVAAQAAGAPVAAAPATAPAGPAAPTAPVAAPAARPTAPATAPATPRASAKERSLAGFDPAAAKLQAAEFRKQLAAGRKAVKAKDYAAGIAALEAALKIDPNHAATLGELGWAAYLAGDLPKAERFTTQAIAAAKTDRTRGATLYNLGRIHEDRGEKDEAATAYQRSQQLRPNATVAARLAALESAGAAVGGHECDLRRRDGRPPFDLCAPVVAALPADPEISENKCREGDTFTTEVAVDAAGTVFGGELATRITLELPGGIQATTFGVERWMEYGGSTTEVYLAVLFDDRWYTTVLGGEYNPGVGYINENFTVDSITAEDLIPGGRPELVLSITWEHSDGDYGDNILESEVEKLVAVLGLDGDAPRWLGAFLASSADEISQMLDDMPGEVAPSRTERRVDHRFANGAVEILPAAGHEPSTKPGSYPLGALPAACPAAVRYAGGA